MPNLAFLSTAHIHTRSFISNVLEANDGRTVGAIWDDNPERGERYASLAEAPFVADLDAVLTNPALDGFIICAENTRHLSLLQKALPTGKPVFCEKPLVTSTSDLEALRPHLGKAPLFCGYYLPFEGEMQAIARLIREGALGEITQVSYVNAHHAAYGRWFDTPDLAWFTEPALSGGGAFIDLGTHAVHLLHTLFGPADEVWAEIGNQSGTYPRVDDFGVALIRFRNGILGRVEASWTHTANARGLTVLGSKGAVWPTEKGYLFGYPGKEAMPVAPVPEVANRVDRLVAVIRGEIPEPALDADREATLAAVATLEAAYRSAKTGRWEKIP